MAATTIRTVAKWVAGIGIALALAGVGAVYAGSAWLLHREHDVPLRPAAFTTEGADPAEGRRLAILVGCLSCHERTGGGGKVQHTDVYLIGAPNLTRVLGQYSDAELERLVRSGVRRDGTSAFAMPIATLRSLSAEDLGQIVAYLRALPPAADRGPGPMRRLSFRARAALVLGEYRLAVDAIDPAVPSWGELPRDTAFARGRYWVSITCSECHGSALRGDPAAGSPSLAIVGGYDLARFTHLLRTGEPLSGRDLGEMSSVARPDFVNFRDDEIADIHAYLRATFGFSAAAP